jgi:Myb-like DNA-binding domain
MPKATEGGHTSQSYYRISPLSVPSDITSPRQYPNIAATMQSSMNSQHMSQSNLTPYPTGGPVQPLQYHQQSIPQSTPLPVRASSGAWTPSDDAQLMNARAQGLNWQPIQTTYFPNKTPNACRKRHERLMDRRNSDDWDVIKLENMAKEYMGMRREIWTQLGNKTGEKWTVVEAKVSFAYTPPTAIFLPETLRSNIPNSACNQGSKTSNPPPAPAPAASVSKPHTTGPRAQAHLYSPCSTRTIYTVRTAIPRARMTAGLGWTNWRLNTIAQQAIPTARYTAGRARA